MPQATNLLRGSLLIVVTTLCFTAMDAQVKYFSIYYMMTGLHGIHVLGGIVVISIMILNTYKGKLTSEIRLLFWKRRSRWYS